MPVKARAPKELRPQFSDEILDLFLEIGAIPAANRRHSSRKSGDYMARVKAFMYSLEMGSEFWMMTSPFDTHATPTYGPGYAAHEAWHVCRRLRLELLQAVEARQASREALSLTATSEAAGPEDQSATSCANPP